MLHHLLTRLQQEWQVKLSERGVAQMPWDPKPQPPAAPQQSQAPHSSAPNGLPQQSYQQYNGHQTNVPNGGAPRVKTEPGTETQYHGLPNTGYPPTAEGGIVRAQHLVQQQYGPNASASLNSMQQQRGGLALPGQQPRPQGLQLPAGSNQTTQQQQQHSMQSQQFQRQQQQAMQHQQQQQQQQQLHQQQQQQQQPRIKVENDTPQTQQGNYQQQPHPSYQTDGADEGLDEWRTMLAERRAINAEQGHQADRFMRDQVLSMSEGLQSGLMVPLEEHPSHPANVRRRAGKAKTSQTASTSPKSAGPSVPQYDGGDDEDDKAHVKDEEDADAINSDLDDSDDDNNNAMGEDDDEQMDNILCTYDKVQRVKNKWKCTLKDGVMSVGGKEWVFHKGQGEFEW